MTTVLSPVDVLTPIVVLLGVGAAAAIASRAVRINPIVGYLLAGVLIGPYALGLIEESRLTQLLAELGVVFLLFDIGMQVSMRELKESRRDLLGLAPAHLVATAAPFVLILVAIGLSWPVALAIGISLGISSTAVVARLMAERGLGSCPLGRSTTHVLIFQDIVGIFLLIFASALGGDPASIPLTMAIAAGQAMIAFGAALVAARYLVGPMFRTLANTENSEAFTAATLLLCLGAALATFQIGLSLTLGAFLAGLAVSSTAFRHQIQTESGPFRGLLLSFFFISVGMMIDVPALIANLPLVILAAAAILVLKTVAGYAAARLVGWSQPGGTQLTFLMAQGSEFTLVVLSMLAVASSAAVAAGGVPLLPPLMETIFVAAVALSLAAAPFWAGGGMRLARWLARRKQTESAASTMSPGDAPVIVFGMTPAGRLAVDALRDHDIAFVALDNDPERFLAATADGYTVAFGDAANLRLIEAIGANKARAVVIGMPRYEVSASMTPVISQRFPGLERYVAVDTPSDVERFSGLGMNAYHSMGEPAGIEMAAGMLRGLGVADKEVSNWMIREYDRFGQASPQTEPEPSSAEAA